MVTTKDKTPTKDPRVAVIRTSDRNSFKMCRRKWNWTSHLRMNLGSKQTGDPLWLGSAMHYALEDMHGYNKYGSPMMALMAYIKAYGDKYPKKVPEDWKTLGQLGVDMMDYYMIWLKGRDPLATHMVDGKPQVEVNVKIEIPWAALEKVCLDKAKFKRVRDKYDQVFYSLQMDRVHKDEYGHLWIVEYKSAKTIQTMHLLNDPQVSTYIWGAGAVYKDPIEGVIYQQHRKAIPEPPRFLNAGTFSVAANQRTSHRAYRNVLIQKYGEVKKAPGSNVSFLNELAKQETEDYDGYVRRDRITRNKYVRQSIAQHILLETLDMLDPLLPLYPSPSRMCVMMCGMIGPCVSMDDGSDWEADLMDECEERPAEYDEWRTELPDPKTFKGVTLT